MSERGTTRIGPVEPVALGLCKLGWRESDSTVASDRTELFITENGIAVPRSAVARLEEYMREASGLEASFQAFTEPHAGD